MAEAQHVPVESSVAQSQKQRQERQGPRVSTWQDTVAAHPALILQVIHVLTRALGAKALSFTALLMTFTLFAWGLFRGTWQAYIIATTFGIGVTLPVLYVGWRPGEKDGQT